MTGTYRVSMPGSNRLRSRRTRGWKFASSLTLLALLASTALASAAEPCTTKPYLIRIHADWCSTCKRLAPIWERIRSSLDEKATIVSFDVTDRAAYEQSRDEAERLGIGDFFARYRNRTGAVAVLDCKTLEPVEVLIGEPDIAKYTEAIARASEPG